MGIVHHGKYLEYFEAARVEYMHRRGVSYLEWTKRGIHLPVVEANIRYRRSVKFDERIAIEATLTELGRATAELLSRVSLFESDFTVAAIAGRFVVENCERKMASRDALPALPVRTARQALAATSGALQSSQRSPTCGNENRVSAGPGPRGP
jgi:YbgC/YbaW family acyl-CoA thioester hydrolase